MGGALCENVAIKEVMHHVRAELMREGVVRSTNIITTTTATTTAATKQSEKEDGSL
jgi:hypothetical protein